jgi:hypothetical protein
MTGVLQDAAGGGGGGGGAAAPPPTSVSWRRQMKAPVWVVLILLFRARIAPVCKKVFL